MKNALKHAIEGTALAPFARRLWLAAKARGFTGWDPLVPEDALKVCLRDALARLFTRVPKERFGDYLEFGVSRGSSMMCAAHALTEAGLPQVRLIGFDSFEGLPPEASHEGWEPGLYRSSMQATRNHLVKRGVDLARVHLVKGWFQDTLNPVTAKDLRVSKANIVMIDCDIYSASKDALRFCAPLIKDSCIIIFDDWGWREKVGEIGQREAFHEFLEENPDIMTEKLESYLPEARVFMVTRTSEQGEPSRQRGVRGDSD